MYIAQQSVLPTKSTKKDYPVGTKASKKDRIGESIQAVDLPVDARVQYTVDIQTGEGNPTSQSDFVVRILPWPFAEGASSSSSFSPKNAHDIVKKVIFENSGVGVECGSGNLLWGVPSDNEV